MNAQILPIKKSNPLHSLKTIREQIKALQAQEKALKEDVFAWMDAEASDKVSLDGFDAQRSLVVQNRVDTKAVKEILGDGCPTKEIEMVTLKVI